MAPRLALAATVAALVLALPALAHAATYCVNAPGCVGTNEPDLQTALTAAAGTTTEADTVQVGDPGPPAGGYSYSDGGNAANQVNIVGAGRSSTVLTATGATVLAVNGQGSSISNLTVQIPSAGGTAIATTGSISNVDIKSLASGSTSQTGVVMSGAGDEQIVGTNITLTLGTASENGIISSMTGGSLLVQDTSLQANGFGLALSPGNVATVRRVRMTTLYGVIASGASAMVDNLAFREIGTTGGVGLYSSPSGGHDSSVTADHVSAYGNGDVGSAGVISTSSGGSGTATFTLRNSIIRHFGYRIVRQTNGAGTTANVSVSYSDFDFGGTVIDQNSSGGSGSIASGPGLLVQDPLWADPSTGDFRLQAGSPAIDTGDPAGLLAGESDTDVLGAPRISNGRTDMGAVELQQPVSVVPAPDTTPPTFKTSKLPKKLTLKKLLAGVTFTVAPNEPSSIDATLRGSARSVKLAKTYNLTLAHRKLGVAAGRRRVTLKVRKKLLGKSRKFTLQLTLVATDAAGNARTLKRTIKVH